MSKLIWTHSARRRILLAMSSTVSVLLPEREAEAACARRLLATSLAAYGLLVDAWRSVSANVFDVLIEARTELTAAEFAERLSSARTEAEERANAYRLVGFSCAPASA